MMKYYKKNVDRSGFTLVELLATITILGILSGIAIVAISAVLKNAHTNYDKSLKNTIISSAKSYYSDHRTLLPKNINEERIIDISYLVSTKYLSPVKDSSGKKNCTGKVKVIRESADKYDYSVINLKCE